MKGEKILIKSTRLKLLVKRGCVISKLYDFIKAKPRRCFEGFMNWVSDERRKGDIDLKYAILADSSLGRTVINKNKHKSIKYVPESEYKKYVNRWNFYDAEQIGDTYEIIMLKKKLEQDMPIQVGCGILDDSKLRMYQLYYDCINKYMSRDDFQYVYCDTDSAYMALTGEFESLIKPELKAEFEKEKYSWFPREANHEDKRKPGPSRLNSKVMAWLHCVRRVFMYGDRAVKTNSVARE
jgi:hypothetical protein